MNRFKGQYFSIPNILSYIRIALVPLIVATFFSKDHRTLSTVLIVLSGLTDCVDGFIARKFNMITDFGKIIDPMADKLTQFTVVVCLGFEYSLLFWLAGLLLFKEFFVGTMGLLVMKKTDLVDGARWYGKLATIMFYLIVPYLLIFTPKGPAAHLAILICIIFMLLSLVMYTIRYSLLLFRNSKNASKKVSE
ncbi:MAG: CDP-alcohol phosphatidyltransferase family protein [Clostridia bacterium]|nr:CDP-alcohol phosphatidyltransferase family protein [Clostridia bacterium]